jgi:hypothetical protein
VTSVGTTDEPALGRFVAERLGLTWTCHHDPYQLGIGTLAGLAVRRNPKRAQLVVSTVLAKHVPATPASVRAAGLLLAARVAEVLDAPGEPVSGALLTDSEAFQAVGRFAAVPVVIGFAETATGLGHLVADAFTGADYVHTTRRPDPYREVVAGFEEEHSHAVGHHLQSPDGLLVGDRPLVLVDDELTTGTTALNFMAVLHARHPRSRYVLAALLDLRPDDARAAFRSRAAELGINVDVVSLIDGELVVPDDVLDRAASLHELPATPAASPFRAAPVRVWPGFWPAHVPPGGRHGFTPDDRAAFDSAIAAVGGPLLEELSGSVLVVGTEELMYAPIRLADWLAAAGLSVRVQTTTRSPVLPLDEDGYAIRRRLVFGSPDEPDRESYLYNVEPPEAPFGCYDHIVVLTEDAPAGCTPLLDALRPWAHHGVHLVPLPSTVAVAAGFGSYRPDEVSWLLTDLSGVELELPTEDREELIQGGRRYFEMLPVEYQPDPEYTALFHQALAEGSTRIAVAVGVVAELVLARAPDSGPVLVSLARAGTPIGILMRRWLAQRHDIDAPHYTISIVRGGGIDEAALHHLLSRYRPEQLRFVDGWTGKGAIASELATAVAGYVARRPEAVGLDPELAVLADPGSCTTLYGTRDDFLIPSACLNSTVSGLVSRTVLRDDLIKPGMFHGAKYYAELADQDVSNDFLDAVSASFPYAAGEVEELLTTRTASPPSWSGRASLVALAQEFGINNLNLVKPGVGETTRVLLRRVPWQILVRPDRMADLRHVLLLAEARGVPVVERTDLAYSCVGLIRPLSST